MKQNAASSNMAKYSWAHDYTINLEDGRVMDRGNYRTRKTESWHTEITAESDNSKPPPGQYRILLLKDIGSQNFYSLYLLDLPIEYLISHFRVSSTFSC